MNNAPFKRRRGFTLIDLLVVIAIFFLVVAFMLPTAGRVRDYAWPTQCGSNLRLIGQAMLEYSNANHGAFPRTTYDANRSSPVAYTGASSAQPFSASGPSANDVTAIFYLLIREQGLNPDVFVCPGTRRPTPFAFETGKKATDYSNFPSERFLSYSIQNAYPSAASGVDPGFWANRFKADFALAADMNSGSPVLLSATPASSRGVMKAANSRNHPQAGQNVLFGDGHVDFVQTVFVGFGQDNIYTFGKPPTASGPGSSLGIVGAPAHLNDSVLLPVATMDPKTVEPTEFSKFLESGLPAKVATVSVALLVISLWWAAKKSRRRA